MFVFLVRYLGATASCLYLSRMSYGSKLGSLELGTLNVTFFISALIGSTYVTKTFGPRDSMMLGMSLVCAYSASILISDESVSGYKTFMIILGSILGGIGSGIMWTGQGVYFACICEEYREALIYKEDDYAYGDVDEERIPPTLEHVTSRFGAAFAAIFMATEFIMILLSRFFLSYLKINWRPLFAIYTVVSIIAVCSMFFVEGIDRKLYLTEEDETQIFLFKEILSTWKILSNRPSMKYFIPFNFSYSLLSRFLETFVIPQASQTTILEGDPEFFNYLLFAVSTFVGVIACLASAYWSKLEKDIQLCLGGASIFMISLLFMSIKSKSQWGYAFFVSIYVFYGIARASSLASLRAIFVDKFLDDRHSAFAQFVLQSGVGHFVGFLISENALCQQTSTYCIKYEDKSIHNVLVIEVLMMILSIATIPSILIIRRINDP